MSEDYEAQQGKGWLWTAAIAAMVMATSMAGLCLVAWAMFLHHIGALQVSRFYRFFTVTYYLTLLHILLHLSLNLIGVQCPFQRGKSDLA